LALELQNQRHGISFMKFRLLATALLSVLVTIALVELTGSKPAGVAPAEKSVSTMDTTPASVPSVGISINQAPVASGTPQLQPPVNSASLEAIYVRQIKL
jgi:hypothetical protein